MTPRTDVSTPVWWNAVHDQVLAALTPEWQRAAHVLAQFEDRATMFVAMEDLALAGVAEVKREPITVGWQAAGERIFVRLAPGAGRVPA